MLGVLQVKGFAWLNLLAFVREQHGEDTLRALRLALPQHAWAFDTSAVLPVAWIDAEVHLAAITWIVNRHYEGTPEGAQRFGFALASRNVSSTFRSFERLEDLKVALISTERAFSQFYSRGTVRLTLTGQVLQAQITDFPAPTVLFGNVLGAGMVAFLRAGHIDATLRSVTVGPSSVAYEIAVVPPPA